METNTKIKAPLVSIIVPVYNAEKYIEQALASIFSQVCDFTFEIIIGDDASSDNSASILKQYAAKHSEIVLICRPKNIGAIENCLDLLSRASGEYLATLEADDIWCDNFKLAKQIAFLQENSQYVGCANKIKLIDDDSKIIKKLLPFWIKSKKNFALKDFKGIFLPSQPSSFVRRNIFLTQPKLLNEISNFHPYVLDRTLALIFLSYGDFYCFDEIMSCYRIPNHKNNSTHLTDLAYKNNANALMNEYKYNENLEQLYFKLNNSKKLFLQRRVMLLCDSLIKAIQYPKQKQTIMKELVKNPIVCFIAIFYFPYSIVKKLFSKLLDSLISHC